MENDARSPLVLVVDDDYTLRELTARLLSGAGYQVIQAGTGQEGLDLARQQRPDLILLDVMLPDLNGLDLCRMLKKEAALASTAIVMVSSSLTQSDQQAAGLEGGADGYIARPVSGRELLARVQAIVRVQQAELALRRYADEKAALYAVTSAATGVFEPKELLSTVIDVILSIPSLPSEGAWVLLPAESGELAEVAARQNAAAENDALAACPDCLRILTGAQPTNGLHENISLQRHAAVPLFASGRVLGVLSVGWPAGHAYSHANAELLVNAGRQVGLALRNAQLYQAAVRLDQMRTLNEIGAAVTASLEIETVIQQVLERTCQAINAPDGSVLLLEPHTGNLVFTQVYGARAAALLGLSMPAGSGVAGWVAENAHLARVNEPDIDLRWAAGVSAATGFTTSSILCAPLIYRGQVTGVIELFNKRGGEFSSDDAGLLEAVASIAAVALENARLFSATRARANELQALHEIGLAMACSLDFNDVVQVALDRALELFSAAGVLFYLLRPEDHQLVCLENRSQEENFPSPTLVHLGMHAARLALKQREVVVSGNIFEDERFRCSEHGETTPPAAEGQTCRVRSLMAVPLSVPNGDIGVLVVTNQRLEAFSPGDADILQSVASIMAVALDNARLYQDLKGLLDERDRTQARMVQGEKISALGRLAASMAHEINNPLQAVQGCLTLLAEELEAGNRREKIDRYLTTVQAEVDRIAAIVRRVREFYRPTREGLFPTQVQQVIESVLELMGKQLQQSRVTVKRTWTEPLPVIASNPDHLKQVFLNLMLNAIDAMPEGGELEFRISHSQVGREAGGQDRPALLVEVCDNGQGMPPELLSKLFEPFTTTKPHGSGLGLYITYNIIKSLQGEAAVESLVGQGTNFRIWLPISQE